MNPNLQRKARGCRGMTLVELMVAITIGLVIIAAMSVLFANNSRVRTETERSSHKVENGRFAMEQLAGELQHAGFLGEFDPTRLTVPGAVPNPCDTTLASVQAAMAFHVQGYNNVSAGTLGCISDVKAGTDVLVVRRASTCTVGSAGCTAPAAGAPVFQASSCSSTAELGNADVANSYRLDTVATAFDRTKRDCTTVADRRRYLLRIYFVANNDKSGDGIPTLKRAELTGSGGALAFSTSSLVQGIENLQVEWGLDTNTNGSPDVYVSDPGSHNACTASTTPTCGAQWASAVTAKAYLLARNLDPSAGHLDNRVYILGSTTVSAPGDAYKRSVFQETVRLVNVSGRRL